MRSEEVATIIKTLIEEQLKTFGVREEKPDWHDSFYGWKTVLFNCECHTFDQVIIQLMKAIKCDANTATAIAVKIHKQGSAVVYNGYREKAEAIAECLSVIGLRTMVGQ